MALSAIAQPAHARLDDEERFASRGEHHFVRSGTMAYLQQLNPDGISIVVAREGRHACPHAPSRLAITSSKSCAAPIRPLPGPCGRRYYVRRRERQPAPRRDGGASSGTSRQTRLERGITRRVPLARFSEALERRRGDIRTIIDFIL